MYHGTEDIVEISGEQHRKTGHEALCGGFGTRHDPLAPHFGHTTQDQPHNLFCGEVHETQNSSPADVLQELVVHRVPLLQLLASHSVLIFSKVVAGCPDCLDAWMF